MSSTKEAKDKDSAELKEKKRRRTLKKTESAPSSTDSRKSRNSVTDSKQNAKTAFYDEENKALQRDAEVDVLLQKEACMELQHVMAEIKSLKDKYDGVLEEEQAQISQQIEDLRVHGMMQFVALRRLNRMAHFRCKKVREATTQAKQRIDDRQLQLQNLLYEVMHLQKEVNKCLDFKSKDEEIELVSVEEFYEEAPKTISQPEVTKTNLHQQTLARLDWEMEQRKRQSLQMKEAEQAKEELAADISTRKDHLDNLGPKLSTILQATKPVQDYLGMPFDEIREQHQIAKFLPRSLYVLYMQASAYRDACDQSLQVSIQGDIEVARSLQSTTLDVDEDSGDSDQEEQEKPAQKRHRRNTTDDKANVRKDRLLKKHPLFIRLSIQCKEESRLQLNVFYMLALEIVTVTIELSRVEANGGAAISGGDLLSADTLLRCLYPEDTGEDTPNPSNKYALQRLGLGEFGRYVAEVGRPYQWVQWLCGIQFLQLTEACTSAGPKADASVSANHMEGTIKRLRQRVQARLSLHSQLSALERCVVAVSSDYQSMFPVKSSSRLASWKRSTYEDFCSLDYCQGLLTVGLVHQSSMYFTGVVERGSAKMTIQAVIGADYPITAPVFALYVHRQAGLSRLTDNRIRDMEAEVNVHYTELSKKKSTDQLLTNQLQRLLMCFDVYLETEGGGSTGQEGPAEFAREKILPRMIRGPHRACPYVYSAQLGFFTQR